MTEEKFSKLIDIWEEIGPFNMDLFGDRLVLQKKIFLLQEAGLELGYTFTAYKRGPYCRELATDGYNINSINSIKSNLKVNITPLKLVEELSKNHKGEIYWFETLATIVYLFKKEKINNYMELKKKFFEYKPHINDESMFKEAYNLLKEKGFIC